MFLSSREWILHSKDPWHVAHKALYLKQWKLDLDMSKLKPSKLPIQVKIWQVPMSTYTPIGLSYIASAISVPLFLDKATKQRACIKFAQVCIEVEIDKIHDLLESTSIDLKGKLVEVMFAYT